MAIGPTDRQSEASTQNDPGVSNDPKTNVGGFEGHIWSSLNGIFERLGKMDQKITQLAADQGELKKSVEKHDKLIIRVTATIAGAIIVISALWFFYQNYLKDHLTYK